MPMPPNRKLNGPSKSDRTRSSCEKASQLVFSVAQVPEADVAALYANNVGQKILSVLNQPYTLSGSLHHNTPSIGLTLFRDHDERVEDILKRADLAMYQSKSAGRNTVRFFDPNMQAVVMARSALERDLRQAVADNELVLFYQPVVNTERRVTGYEALVRWKHPQRGMVSPAEFIPVAEQTGLILPIGAWVLRTACEQLAAWAHHPDKADLTLAVNLSARQLRHAEFVPDVLQLLAVTGARPQRLKPGRRGRDRQRPPVHSRHPRPSIPWPLVRRPWCWPYP